MFPNSLVCFHIPALYHEMTAMPRIQTHHDSRVFRRMRNRNLTSHFVFSLPLPRSVRHFPTASSASDGSGPLSSPPPSSFSLAPNQMLFGDSLSFKSPRRKDIRQLQQSNRLIPSWFRSIMRFSLIKRNEEAPLSLRLPRSVERPLHNRSLF